jgi:hypothetical protein
MKVDSSSITYIPGRGRTQYAVRLLGKTVGNVKLAVAGDGRSGWCYFPKGQREGGKVFPTLDECKRSL